MMRVGWIVVFGVIVSGCGDTVTIDHRTTAVLNVADAAAADKLEIAVGPKGDVIEVEYHISPALVPSAVRAAMDELFPGDDVGAEKERHGDETYYELARVVDGLKMEAMFSADGTLHSIEAELKIDDVPQAVQDKINELYPACKVTSWEAIKDKDQAIIEYHVKLIDETGRNLKVFAEPLGVVFAVYREMVAEVEVSVKQ